MNTAMKTMALEFSTETASLALLAEGAVVTSHPVAAGHRRSQGLFDAVEELLRDAGWTWAEVEAFAVGRGPGSYTGLRVSLTAANGWALPENKPVWTVTSAAALAAEWLAEHPGAAQVVVSGAARRGTVWAGRFGRGDGIRVVREGDWTILPEAERGTGWPGVPWTEPGRVPQAEWVGRLCHAGGASEELQPVYLHPAVVAAPRFDATGRHLT
jgi:tRNA threonylcarbamoyladenosine biosynthesis protein TsaB